MAYAWKVIFCWNGFLWDSVEIRFLRVTILCHLAVLDMMFMLSFIVPLACPLLFEMLVVQRSKRYCYTTTLQRWWWTCLGYKYHITLTSSPTVEKWPFTQGFDLIWHLILNLVPTNTVTWFSSHFRWVGMWFNYVIHQCSFAYEARVIEAQHIN